MEGQVLYGISEKGTNLSELNRMRELQLLYIKNKINEGWPYHMNEEGSKNIMGRKKSEETTICYAGSKLKKYARGRQMHEEVAENLIEE